MTKETVKVAGRQLGKVCLKHPTIALDYMLERIQNFYNLIEPVVNAMKYLSPISFDVLACKL
jgi:THO complex subunit 2